MKNLLLGVLATLLLAGAGCNIASTAPTPDPVATAAETPAPPVQEELSYFERYYVNAGGKTARIPLKFCLALYDYYNECGLDLRAMTIDLAKDNLPVDKIESAATDVNTRIVYEARSEVRKPNGCMVPDLYVYDLKAKTTKKLKNDERMWTCGAVGSYIASVSNGGRYVRIETTGPSEAGAHWLYDIDRDVLDQDTAQSPFTLFVAQEDGPIDEFVVYLGGCEKQEMLTIGSDCDYALMLRDNRSGGKVHLKAMEDAVKAKDIAMETIYEVEYELGTDSLTIGTGNIGGEVVLRGLRKAMTDLGRH